jgi:prepilin-type processing-associated H-X9-DG protein
MKRSIAVSVVRILCVLCFCAVGLLGQPAPDLPPKAGEDVRTGNCDYLYFGKGRKEADSGREDPIACTKPGLFTGGYVNVLYGDGHVQGYRTMPQNVKQLIDAAADQQ